MQETGSDLVIHGPPILLQNKVGTPPVYHKKKPGRRGADPCPRVGGCCRSFYDELATSETPTSGPFPQTPILACRRRFAVHILPSGQFGPGRPSMTHQYTNGLEIDGLEEDMIFMPQGCGSRQRDWIHR